MATDVTAASNVSDALAQVAVDTVDRVAASSDQGRPVARHLLAADALITYALEARATTAPDELVPWAQRLARQTGATT
jgi:hypothetical protein